MRKKFKWMIFTAIILTVILFQIWWTIKLSESISLETMKDYSTNSPYSKWDSPISEYHIESQDTQFQELWVLDNVFFGDNNHHSCQIIGSENGLYVLGSLNIEQRLQTPLYKFDIKNGVVDWQSELIPNGKVITLNSNQIYVHHSLATISAFDVESGNKKWNEQLFFFFNKDISQMWSTNNMLFVEGDSEKFDILDAYSGQVKNTQFNPDSFPIHLDNDIYHSLIAYRRLLAKDVHTNRIIWEIEFDEDIRYAPFFTEDYIFAKESEHNIGKVYAIARDTGQIIWETEDNVISNVIGSNKRVYFLTNESELLAVDSSNGEYLGKIQFSPSMKELDEFDLINNDYCLANSGNIVVVYLGSGRQLYSFQFNDINE